MRSENTFLKRIILRVRHWFEIIDIWEAIDNRGVKNFERNIMKVNFKVSGLRTICSIIATLFILDSATAQIFEGEIIYVGKLIDATGMTSKEEMDSANYQINLSLRLIFKKDRYKMIFADKDSISSISVYKPEDSTILEHRKSRTIIHDSRVSEHELGELTHMNEKEIIKGIECSAVRIKSADGKSMSFSNDVTYFFNKDHFKIDPKFFRAHQRDFYNHYVNEAKSLPLKVVVNMKMALLEFTMVGFKKRKVNLKEFVVSK